MLVNVEEVVYYRAFQLSLQARNRTVGEKCSTFCQSERD